MSNTIREALEAISGKDGATIADQLNQMSTTPGSTIAEALEGVSTGGGGGGTHDLMMMTKNANTGTLQVNGTSATFEDGPDIGPEAMKHVSGGVAAGSMVTWVPNEEGQSLIVYLYESIETAPDGLLASFEVMSEEGNSYTFMMPSALCLAMIP